jgi:putative phosphoesterase
MMKIAILSDSHDHEENLKQVLEGAKNTDLLVHCGDLIAPFTMTNLGQWYTSPIHFVWGNNDGDHARIEENAAKFPHIILHGDQGEFTVEGKKIVFLHYPEPAEKLARSGDYNLVCYGHTHRVDLRTIKKTILLNPGDVMGRFDSQAHYAVYDTETGKVEMKAIGANPA